jgi:hypothetical protein
MVVTALFSTFLLTSIIPLSLLFAMTCVVGLPIADPTPDLFDRSLQIEARSWNYASNCKPRAPKSQCQFGAHTTTGSKNVDLTVFDEKCSIIKSTTVPIGHDFTFDAGLSQSVDVHFYDPDNPPSNACIDYKKKQYNVYNNAAGGFDSPDGKEHFSLIWFNC